MNQLRDSPAGIKPRDELASRNTSLSGRLFARVLRSLGVEGYACRNARPGKVADDSYWWEPCGMKKKGELAFRRVGNPTC